MNQKLRSKLNLYLSRISKSKCERPIVINGLLGDFFAIDGFTPKEKKLNVDLVCYLGIDPSNIPSIENMCKISFPKAKQVLSFWNDSEFTEKYKYEFKDLILRKVIHSVGRKFDSSIKNIKSKSHEYQGSSFLETKLANIDNNIENYAFIHPRSKGKGFDDEAWKVVDKILHKNNLKGVIFGNQDLSIPLDNVINMNNKTTLFEAMEWLKGAKMFIGISSCFASLAAKIFPADKIVIMTLNEKLLESHAKQFYYAPQTTFDFIHLNKINIDFIKVL